MTLTTRKTQIRCAYCIAKEYLDEKYQVSTIRRCCKPACSPHPGRDFAFIVDEPVPRELVSQYVTMGLPEKADAFIGAFAEWMQVRYLISDNRHFLRDLRTDAYEVLDAAELIQRWEMNTL
jgi:hypothetical protein